MVICIQMYTYNLSPFHSYRHKLTFVVAFIFFFSWNLAFSLNIHIYVASIMVKIECYIQPFFSSSEH